MLARCCGCSPLKSCRFSWSGLARAICEMGHNLYDYDVRCGSWLCENAKTLNRDRRSYSSKTALGLQFESAFNLVIELKNVILVAFRLFAFLHSQGQTRTSRPICRMSASPRRTDIPRLGRHVRFVQILLQNSKIAGSENLANVACWRFQ